MTRKKIPDHYYESIQGWFNFRGVYENAVREAKSGAQFVEVGCWKGRSTAFLGVEILKSGKKITLHCVDHFLGSDEEVHQSDPEVGALLRVFEKNTTPLKGLDLEVHVMESVDAADQFKDGSVDFVWLDAGHDYESVKRDIEAWLPKVKPGGMIGGDDFPMQGVAKAVKEFGDHELHIENGWTVWTKRI
jgi:SAM-dependent methyltransferase